MVFESVCINNLIGASTPSQHRLGLYVLLRNAIPANVLLSMRYTAKTKAPAFASKKQTILIEKVNELKVLSKSSGGNESILSLAFFFSSVGAILI